MALHPTLEKVTARIEQRSRAARGAYLELIERARDAADELLRREPAAAHAHLERWLGGKQEFFKA